jgi:hypothetical protein
MRISAIEDQKRAGVERRLKTADMAAEGARTEMNGFGPVGDPSFPPNLRYTLDATGPRDPPDPPDILPALKDGDSRPGPGHRPPGLPAVHSDHWRAEGAPSPPGHRGGQPGFRDVHRGDGIGVVPLPAFQASESGPRPAVAFLRVPASGNGAPPAVVPGVDPDSRPPRKADFRSGIT